jgi:regulator-associated protein of mTOR
LYVSLLTLYETIYLIKSLADGIVRMWRPEGDEPAQLVSAFRAIPSLINVKRGPGLVFDWSQMAGALTVGGDSKEIVVWDAASEGKVEV